MLAGDLHSPPILCSVLVVIRCIDFLLCDDVVLRSKSIELIVSEDLVWVLKLGQSFLDTLFLVFLLCEYLSFDLKLFLQIGGLGVESIVVSHSLAKVASLPQTKRKSTEKSHSFKGSNLLV